jgi:hypothetical protein
MKLYCDNKGGLTNAFKPIRPGITPYLNTNHDMIEVTQSLIKLIPIVITTQWVKGHYSDKKRQYKHDLNDAADKLAGDFQLSQEPHHSIKKPIAPPDFKVWLLFDSSVATSKIKQITRDGLHNTPIMDHIKKAGWTPQIFASIHWDAHERAFKQLPRFYQYSTAKLCHGLVNTNHQNHLYYGQSPLCPICSQEDETMVHVFTCSYPRAMCHRQTRLAELCNDLETAGTPLPVVQAVRHGFTKWESDPTLRPVRALTAGSLRGADAVLTSAFREQFTFIGWYHLCLGRISKQWARAVQHYVPPRAHNDGSLHWASVFIVALWKYSKALWAFWNEIVYGATVEEQVNRQLDTLRQRITTYYQAYADNPNMILSRHHYLFTSRTIEERLSSPYDIMAAWIRSVEEAIQVLQHHTASLRAEAHQIFP